MSNKNCGTNHAFPYSTASSKTIDSFPRVESGTIIREVESLLIRKAREYTTMDYIYVTDKENILLGAISIKEILRTDKETKVDEVMKKDLIVAHRFTHQERLVYLALSHNLKAIPVVDDDRHLMGIVPYDVILCIFNEEMHEDIFKFGGIYHKLGKELMTVKYPAWLMIKSRLPWLIIGLAGGILTASIVSSFERVISNLLALAAFTPVLAYLSDAAGTQSETLTVRSLALDPKISLRKYALRELQVALSLALVCGLLLGAAAAIGWVNPKLGLIVGISMFLSIVAAISVSTLFPFLFRRFNLDPALGSGPLATMISDIVTIAIYFIVATILLEHGPFF